MTTSTYRLTVKFAPPGVPYFNEKKKEWETSTWGHVWLEARKPGESLDAKPSFSAGWSTGRTVFAKGEDNLSKEDWKNYQSGNGKQISSITVDISKEQFDKLDLYPNLAVNGKIPGFSKRYDAGDNSCIDFSGKGLGHIGLADKNFDGSSLFWARPEKQVNAFLEQIAKHRPQGAGLTVEHRGRTYVFAENERDVKKFWKTVDPYWYLAQEENQREQPYQYAQADIPKRPSFSVANLPPHVQTLFNDNKALLTEFCRDECIAYPQDKTDNIAMAMTAACIANRMPRASLIDIEYGEISIAYDAVDFRETAVMMDKAAATPVYESMNRIEQTEQMFEQQRQLALSQSRGMSLS